jgi:proliferating cell nuclear antigen
MKINITNLVKSDVFSAVFQNMKVFAENVNIMLDEERMFIQAMDSGHVSVIELNIPAVWFDKYEVANNTTIGINSLILSKILSTRDKSQHIELEYDDNGEDRMTIRFVSDDKSIFDKTFEVPLVDLDSEMMTIPAVEYNAEFSLPSANFASLVNQLKLFGETMDIDCSEENIALYSDSQDCGKMSAKISIEDLTSFAIDEGEHLNMSFSLAHLHSIAQFNKLAKEVELKLKHNHPIQVVYNLGGEDTTLRFYLAPKIGDAE